MSGAEKTWPAYPPVEGKSWAKAESRPNGGLIQPSGWLAFETGMISGEMELKNLETAVSLLQTAQAGLNKLDRQLGEAIGATQEAWIGCTRETPPPAQLAQTLGHKLAQMDETVRGCRFHGRGLLDGQSGLVGRGAGGVDFVRGGPDTVSSPPQGYPVHITKKPTRGFLVGGVPVDPAWIEAETELFLAEGDRFIRFKPAKGMTVEVFLDALAAAIHQAGMNMTVGLTRNRRLFIRHTQYGSQVRFKGTSRSTPLLSKRPGKLEWNRRGKDVEGNLAGEPAYGVGRVLIGYVENRLNAELAVAWRESAEGDGQESACHVVQNGIVLQEGDERNRVLSRLSLPSFRPAQLGGWVDTLSGYRRLSEVKATTWEEVLDTLYMLYSIAGELEEWKEKVAIWIERYQNKALAALRRGRAEHNGLESGGPKAMAHQLRRQIGRRQALAE